MPRLVYNIDGVFNSIDRILVEERNNIEYADAGWTVAQIMYHKGKIDACHDIKKLLFDKSKPAPEDGKESEEE